MANICEYKMIVKGRKNDCYQFMEGQNHYDQDIDYESGTEEEYELMFSGTCKWSVDQYCSPDETVKGRSEAFDVEVMCNSRDAEGDPEVAYYEHYRNGVPVGSKLPDELVFEDTTDLRYLTAGEAGFEEENEAFRTDGKLVTQNGNTFLLKDNRLFFNQIFSVKIPENADFIVRHPDDDDEETEDYLEIADVLNTDDEDDDDVLTIGFKFSDPSSENADDESFFHTYLDDDIWQIKYTGISQRGNFFDSLFGNRKIKLVVSIRIKEIRYYLTAFINAKTEAALTSEIRLLEDFLNSIVLCEDNKAVKFPRVSNWKISRLYDAITAANDSSDDDDED